ncbi:MAG: glycosyltransferase family 2 protein [Streptosporangiaceae bacterium]
MKVAEQTVRLAESHPASLAVSVVICAYTERRWDETVAAVRSAVCQRPCPAQVVLVIDHNPALAARARKEITGVTVVESQEPPGLSGARNTGLRMATEPITVFLDDDAQARDGWLAALVSPYQRPEVVATGGGIYPWWPADPPQWLPSTFYWVIGCSYRGMPEREAIIRNPIGANMSVRTDLALGAGAFNSGIGRVGRHPRGCEETELAIRLTAAAPGLSVVYVPAAVVDHHVAAERLRLGYFLRRCWYEGRSKADVVRLTGVASGLESERRHAAAVIPAELLRDLRAAIGGEAAAALRMVTAVTGLAAAAGGYLSGQVSYTWRGAGPFRQCDDRSR